MGWAEVAAVALGYGAQWLRALKGIDNRLVAVLIVMLAAVLYWVGTPGADPHHKSFYQGALVWALSLRGVTGFTHDVGIAKPTDSI
jgi:hypothetical protein